MENINQKQLTKTSRLLSKVLRHAPQSIGIELDGQGWTSVTILLEKLNSHGHPTDMALLKEIVEQNNKQRFALDEEKMLIRANQGHSVPVDLGYQPAVPPDILYHGTAEQRINSILSIGLTKQRRHHVHLSKDLDTATNVGARHGKVVIFEVLPKIMADDEFHFYCSDNGVWLTEHVPVEYLRLKD